MASDVKRGRARWGAGDSDSSVGESEKGVKCRANKHKKHKEACP